MLFKLAIEKRELRVAFQILALEARIFNYWQSDKPINLKALSAEEIDNLLKHIQAIE